VRRIVPLLVVGVLAALPAVARSAPTPAWTKLGATTDSNLPVASLALDGGRVVGAWWVPGATNSAQVVTFAPTVADAGRAPANVEAAAGWATLSDPVLLARPGGGLQILLSGLHSTTTGDPLSGTSFALRNADGSFGPPVPVAGTGEDAATAAILASDGATPLFASARAGGLVLYRGAANPARVDVAAAVGPDTYYVPVLGRDGAGRYWLAWYSLGRAPRPSGLYVAQVDPATGALAGPAALAPASGSIDNESLAVALACGPAACRLIYHETGADGLSTNRVVTWAPGEAAPAPAVSTGQPGPYLAGAYTGDGRLWIAWYDRTGGGTYRAKLGDARGAGGQVVDLGQPPHGPVFSAYSISAIATGVNLAVVTNFSAAGGVDNEWATVTAPGTAAAAGAAGVPDLRGIPNPSVIRRGPNVFIVPKRPSLAQLRKTKCVNVRVQSTKPATVRVAIFSGRKSVRIFGARIVRFPVPAKQVVCIRVPLRAHTFDVRQPFRFAFAVKLGAHPGARTPARLTVSGFTSFK
jgi:hypothetical protein